MTGAAVETSRPVQPSERTWGPIAVYGNTASAAIAVWCFMTGGYVAAYETAGRGAIGIVAGTMIGVFISLLAALPPATRYGLEAVRSTRPTLGVRGSWFTLVLVMAILVGWNSVLTIYLGDSAAEALAALGVVGESSAGALAVIIGLVSCVIVVAMLRNGQATLRLAGPIIAVTVLVTAAIMTIFMFVKFGAGTIFSAPALDPLPDKSTNYMIVIELGIAGAVAWWPYIGGLTRNARSTRTAVIPSVLGLGLSMGAILCVGLFAAVVVPASGGNPTLFMIESGGVALGLVALIFIALSTIGTTMVGVYACALGLKQIKSVDRAVSWRTATIISTIPVAIVVAVLAEPFMAHYGTFLAFAGVTLGPLCGVQVADYFLLRRQVLDVRGLYDDGARTYWYLGGFNPAGFVAIAAGVVTYLFVLDPVTFTPGTQLFSVMSATVPAFLASGLVYLVLMKAAPGLLKKSMP